MVMIMMSMMSLGKRAFVVEKQQEQHNQKKMGEK